MVDSKENQKFDLGVKKLRFRVQIYSNIGVYFRNVYFLLHSTKLSILNVSAPTESVFLTASSMRWNDLEIKNCMGRKQNGQHLQGWLFSIFRALFKAMIMFSKNNSFFRNHMRALESNYQISELLRPKPSHCAPKVYSYQNVFVFVFVFFFKL